MQAHKSKIFVFLLLIFILISVSATYFNTIILKNFYIENDLEPEESSQ